MAYKYSNNQYYFTVGYNAAKNYFYYLYYFQISFRDDTKGEISFINKIESRLKDDIGYSYYPNSENISCKTMISSSLGKILTCFYGLSHVENSLAAFSFDPDNNFSFLLMSNIYPDSNDKAIKYITSTTNNDKSKALICYVIETENGKCVSYDINTNIISELIINSNICQCNYFSLRSYYFEKPKEYMFACIDGNEIIYIKRFDLNFNIIDDNDIYNGIKILNCNKYNLFSIVYVAKKMNMLYL